MAYTTIDDPSAYFQTKLYTGNDSSRAITFDGNTDMQPDWSWFKARSEAYNHAIFDSVRGTTKLIRPNQTNAEETHSTTLTAFGSNGFSLGGGDAFTNADTVTYASWHWKAGTSFTNDASATGIGTIDSTGSVNDTAGFSIVSWTGTGSIGSLKHGLSTTPSLIILKKRSGSGTDWITWGSILGGTVGSEFLKLNNTTAKTTGLDSSWFNNTAPTSSVFTVGTQSDLNGSSATYIAYCFAEKKGYSKFGSYTGNGNADGTFVYTGFKPAWFMIKNIASGNNWHMMDNKRDSDNVVEQLLKANASDAENTTSGKMDFLSNGVKIRSTSTGANGSGATFIYMAFAENPFVTSTGVPATAR